eukprot:scaffold63499_cov63-Phaeocystis_antarctica.AAC.7
MSDERRSRAWTSAFRPPRPCGESAMGTGLAYWFAPSGRAQHPPPALSLAPWLSLRGHPRGCARRSPSGTCWHTARSSTPAAAEGACSSLERRRWVASRCQRPGRRSGAIAARPRPGRHQWPRDRAAPPTPAPRQRRRRSLPTVCPGARAPQRSSAPRCDASRAHPSRRWSPAAPAAGGRRQQPHLLPRLPVDRALEQQRRVARSHAPCEARPESASRKIGDFGRV